MPLQDVSTKTKDRSIGSVSAASGCKMDDLAKKKKKKAREESGRREDEHTEWKVMIKFKKEGRHFHPVKLTKAIENETGKITFAKFLSNRRLLIFAKKKSAAKR